jgi:hypothetical protein
MVLPEDDAGQVADKPGERHQNHGCFAGVQVPEADEPRLSGESPPGYLNLMSACSPHQSVHSGSYDPPPSQSIQRYGAAGVRDRPPR